MDYYEVLSSPSVASSLNNAAGWSLRFTLKSKPNKKSVDEA